MEEMTIQELTSSFSKRKVGFAIKKVYGTSKARFVASKKKEFYPINAHPPA